MTTKAAASRPSTRGDAVALLRADHKRVDQLFASFEAMKGDGRNKAQLVRTICEELRLHMLVEEEIFYPAVRLALKDDALMDEAEVEHASAKQLINELEHMEPGDEYYDARVTVLGEYIKHHVKEEHTDMFPKARQSAVDLRELGRQIHERKLSQANSSLGDTLFAKVLASMPPL